MNLEDYALAGVIILSAALGGFSYIQKERDAAKLAAKDTQIATLQQQYTAAALKGEQDARKREQAVRDSDAKTIAGLQSQVDARPIALASARQRLRTTAARGCVVPSIHDSKPSDDSAPVELPIENAERILSIASEADAVADQLRACQQIVRNRE